MVSFVKLLFLYNLNLKMNTFDCLEKINAGIMKKTVLLIVFLFTVTLLFGKVKGVKHVVLIGLDGWGAYSVPQAEMPTVKRMMEGGTYTLKSRSVLPSSSACNWASMIMGASPEIHGFTTWGSKKPEIPSRELSHYGLFPTVIGLLRDQKPEAEIGYIFEWDGMQYLCEKEAVNHFSHVPAAENGSSDAIVQDVVQYIREKKPVFTMIAFNNPDEVGHKYGHDTPEYYAKLKELDNKIAQIVQAVQEAGIYEETVFILTADHGGINKGHGGKTLQEMQIPFIIFGKGIRAGHVMDSSTMIYDTASTIAWIFGLKQPQVWIGRPIMEAFK